MINGQVCEAWEKIEEIKIKLRNGAAYDRCKKEAAPYIATLNEAGQKVADDNGRKFTKLSFTSLMR